VYRAYLLIFLLLCACKANPPVDTTSDYGETYFELDCVWVDPQETTQPALWACFEEVDTDLLSGFLYLELESTISLYLCGENLTLRSDIDMYDNLISYLTRDKFDCLHITEDKEKGNAFDWSWESSENRLQVIWRPDDEDHKMITLVIKDKEYNQVVRSIVYYKTLPPTR